MGYKTVSEEVQAVHSHAESAITQLLKRTWHDDKGFSHIPTETLDAASRSVRLLKQLYSQFEGRDIMIHLSLTQHATFWQHTLLPAYVWSLQCLWADLNKEGNIQSDTRMRIAYLRCEIEEAVINVLPSKPYYQPLDGLELDRWSQVLSAIVLARIPLFLARELEALRRYLLETAKFPQPAVRVDDATRCLLLAVRVAHLGLRPSDACSAIAESRLVEHACALRMTLAERPWSWDSTELDSCLYGVLKRAAQSLPWRWLQGVPSCTAPVVLIKTPRVGISRFVVVPPDAPPGEQEACEQLWRVLSAASVQCFLGWWLAASMVVLRPGGSGFSLPGSLLVACRSCWQRRGGGGDRGGRQREDLELRGLQTPLHAAAASWMYGMLTRRCRGASAGAVAPAAKTARPPTALGAAAPGPTSAAGGAGPAAAAAAAAAAAPTTLDGTATAATTATTATAAVAGTEAAASQPASGSAAPASPASAPPGDDQDGVGAAAAATASADAPELPYTAQNMYDMLLPVCEFCVEFVASVSALGSLFSDTLATAALALALSLQHMSPDASVARLPSCWQLLGRILAMDLGAARSRALRDLAQAMGRVLRLPPPGPGVSRPSSAVSSSQDGGGRGSSRSDIGGGAAVAADSAAAAVATLEVVGPSAGFTRPTPGGGDEGAEDAAAHLHLHLQQKHEHRHRHQQLLQQHPHQQHPHQQHQQHQLHQLVSGMARYQQPSLTLRCALGSLFLPSLERSLRSLLYVPTDKSGPAIRPDAAYDLASACVAVDLALRRPGCWPALLAHTPPQQIAALILTMRKLTIAADEMPLLLQPPPISMPQAAAAAGAGATAAAAAAAAEAQPLGDPRVVWRLQLVALLEQCLPFTRTPGAAAAAVTAAAAAAESAGAAGGGSKGLISRGSLCRIATMTCPASPPSSRGAVRMAPAPEPPGPYLYVNHGLCGTGAAASPRGSFAAAATADADADADAGGASADQRETDIGPSWREVLSFGPCPAVGSPARSQQERMAVLAATSWLPLLLTTTSREDDGGYNGGSDGKGARRVPVPISVLSIHGGHRVAWQWLLLAARQCLAAVGTEAHASWMRLLRRTLVVDQITAVLRVYCNWEKWSERVMTTDTAVAISTSGGAPGFGGDTANAGTNVGAAAGAHHAYQASRSPTGDGGGSSGSGGPSGIDMAGWALHEAAARVCEVLPVVLDVLEVLVAASPEAVALALSDNRQARRFICVADDLGDAAAAAGVADDGPLPDGRSPAALAQHQRRRQQRQRREDQRLAALPPGWGPGLPLDSAVVSVLSQYGRRELIRSLGELSRVQGDRFSFRPQGLAAPPAAAALQAEFVVAAVGGDGGSSSGWQELPDPVAVVRHQLGFAVCAYDGCSNLEGSSEATLLLRAGGGGGRGRGRPAVSYCCVACQQADRLATAAVAAVDATRGSDPRRRASGRDWEAV